MKNIFTLLLLHFSLITVGKTSLTVAKDGSGDYRTVQAAINAVPNESTEVTVIFIKKGIYKEKLDLPVSKKHVTMIGESREETILTYDDFASKLDSAGKNIGTSGSASFHIYGDDFTAENITFQNSAGTVGQAVAVRVTGTRAYFKNCIFLGFQDTLYTHGFGTVELFENCYIEGTVDFIFGAATAWFEGCHIFCKKGGGYISAAATPDTVKYGYVFSHCIIDGDAPANSFYLGRPWRPYAKTVFIKCKLPVIIKPEGWLAWSNEKNLMQTYYGEYQNYGSGFSPLHRPGWTYQLAMDSVAQYTITKVLNGWHPK